MPIFFGGSNDPNARFRGNSLPGFSQRRSATGGGVNFSPEELKARSKARWSERYAADARARAASEERKSREEAKRKDRKARREKYRSPEEVARRSQETKARLDRRKAAAAQVAFDRPAPSTQFSNQPAPVVGQPMGMLPDNMIRTSQGGSAKTEYTKPSMSPSESVLSASKGLLDLGPARTRTATPSAAFGYPTGQAPSFRYSPNQANAQRFYIDQPPPAMFQALPEDRYTQPIYNYLGDLVGDLGNAFGAAGGQLFSLPNSVNQALRNARGF
jgi:hypothetical protein